MPHINEQPTRQTRHPSRLFGRQAGFAHPNRFTGSFSVVQVFICFFGLLFFRPTHLTAEVTILILGDSLTAGYGIEKQEAFPQVLSDKLQELGFKDTKVINGGFSGSTTASAIKRLRWYLKIKPDILILELGANDGLRGHAVESIRDNLSKAIQFAQDNAMQTVLAGMKLPVNYGNDYTRQFETVFKSLAVQFSIPLIPFLLEGVAGNPDLNLPDGIHPNPEGHRIVAETVLPFVLPLLTSKNEPDG